MRYRTLSPNSSDAANYRLRGITVAERWNTFESFLADLGECPPRHSLERIDNGKGYGPENCKWATRAEQNRNTRRNRWVTLGGSRMVLKDAVTALGISESAIYQRMKRRGISMQQAIDHRPTPRW